MFGWSVLTFHKTLSAIVFDGISPYKRNVINLSPHVLTDDRFQRNRHRSQNQIYPLRGLKNIWLPVFTHLITFSIYREENSFVTLRQFLNELRWYILTFPEPYRVSPLPFYEVNICFRPICKGFHFKRGFSFYSNSNNPSCNI